MYRVLKTSMRSVVWTILVFALLFSEFPVGVIVDILHDKNVVDVLWQSGRQGKLDNFFRPHEAYATAETFTAGSAVYDGAGSTSWTAPAGVYAVTVEVWGGGGGGGGNTQASADGGGGGGGGAYAKKAGISVTPGNGYTVVVGSAGTAGAGADGGGGGDSYFIDTSTVMAKGGSGGTRGQGTSPGAGGAGGAAGNSVGDPGSVFSGGNGGAGRNNATGRGGGGGGSAGLAASGSNGTAGSSGTAGAVAVLGGGAGGDGIATGNGYAPGSGPGGGGGGGGEGATASGGDGYAGQLRITYTYTWTAPANVYSVDVEVWGAGGGGGGQDLTSDGGGGGGGGAYAKKTSISVSPGNPYIFVVGSGGLGGSGEDGSDGGDSYFKDVATVMAKGGGGGQNSTGTPPPGGGGGAGVGTSVGDVGAVFAGGNGGAGRNNTTGRGGPGGSSAGTSAAGTDGPTTWTTATAAAPPSGGGIGGNGGNANLQDGFAPASGSGGGGGGGAEDAATDSDTKGGQGADGKIVITYTANNPPFLIVSQPDGTNDTVNAGQLYDITYDLSDSEDNATVDFYYDSDSSGLNGTLITGCQDKPEGSGATCSWNTTGMTPGEYYVYGIATDGLNPDVSDYSSGIITINAAGSLEVDIVDEGGDPVGSPSVDFSEMEFSFNAATTTATFGISTQKIRVDNQTATPAWSLTVAATSTTAVWYSAAAGTYDYNDPTYSQDGGDADSVGGALYIDPNTSTITPQGGCDNAGLSKGSAIAFAEGTTNSITLLSADGTADTGCYWDVTGISLDQRIPAAQQAGSYSFALVLTVN